MKKILTQLGRFILLAVAGVIYAAAIALFLDPNNMAPGGVSGISVIINRITGVETGTLIFLINIPVMILGAYRFGIKFILSTVYALFIASTAMNIFSAYGFVVTQDRMLAAVIGGSLMGLGIGITFRLRATTGGADIIVKILLTKFPFLKSGQKFLMLDATVILLSAIVFRDIEVALYAAIAVFVSSVVMDRVLYGSGAGKLVYIISKNPEPVTERLLKEIDVGVSYLKGEGAYTNDEKKIILCVVRNYTLPKLRNIVREEDADAFMFVSPATEVFGEGYKPHDSEDL